jgi:hypothetical protein
VTSFDVVSRISQEKTEEFLVAAVLRIPDGDNPNKSQVMNGLTCLATYLYVL